MQEKRNNKNEYKVVREYCGKYSCEEMIRRIIKNQLVDYQNNQRKNEKPEV